MVAGTLVFVGLASAVLGSTKGSCGAEGSEKGTCGAAGDGGHKGKYDIDSDAFIARGNEAMFVMWYSPSCGHCKRLAPDFDAVAEAFANDLTTADVVKVASLDATANRELAQAFAVKAYPTLHFFEAGAVVPVPCTSRTRKGMTAFINEQTGLAVAPPPTHKKETTKSMVVDASDKFDQLVEDADYMVVLWKTSSKQSDLANPEYERIARWYHRDDVSGEAERASVLVTSVSGEDRQDLCEKFGVDTFPAITIHHGGLNKPVRYDMASQAHLVVALSSVKIMEWITRETKRKEGPLLPESATQTCTGTVSKLTADTFHSFITSHSVALVEFYAPWCGHCKKLSTTYNKVAKAFHRTKNVGIAAVDCDEYKDLCTRFDVAGYPTLKSFAGDADAAETVDAEHTLAALVAAVNVKAGTTVTAANPRSAVTVATGETLDDIVLNPHHDVMILFYAPWCPHCQKVLGEIELVAASMAMAPDANVTIAMLDAEKYKDAARMWGGTHRYPTMEYFPRGDKSGLVPWVYMSPMTADHMLAYIDEQTGSHTLLCAGLGERAGVEEGLTEMITTAYADGSFDKAAEEVEAVPTTHYEHALNLKVYAKALRKMQAKGFEYAAKEIKRLEGMLAADKRGGVPNDRVASMTRRRNVLAHIVSCQ